MLVIKNSL